MTRGAEERWAQKLEWDQERDELEINSSLPALNRTECEVCGEPATKRLEVKRVQDRSGIFYDVCDDDEDEVFALFRADMAEGADPDDD